MAQEQEREIEDLVEAFYAARDAGDGEAAGRLAEAIRARRQEKNPTVEGYEPQLGRAAMRGLRNFAVGTAGLPGATGNLLANVPALNRLENPYGFEGAEGRMRELVGPAYAPQGRLERAVTLGSEFVPAAATGGLARRATIRGTRTIPSVGSAAVDETGAAAAAVGAQQALYDTPAEGPATAIASLVGGAGSSMGRIREATPQAAVRSRISDMRDADWRRAVEVSRRAKEMGFPLTPDEALEDEGLRQIVAGLVEQPEGAEVARLRRARADQRGSMAATLDEMEPGTFREVMRRFQRRLARTDRPVATLYGKAEEAAQELRNRRSRAVEPYYIAARQPGQEVDETLVRQLDDAIDQALQRQAEGSPGQQQLQRLRQRITRTSPDGATTYQTNAGLLDNVYREFRDMERYQPGNPNMVPDQGIAASRDIVSMLGEITATNPNIARARRTYQRYTNRLVNPVLQGPLGILARGDPSEQKRMANVVNAMIGGRDFDAGEMRTLVNRMAAVEGGQEALEGMLNSYMDELVEQSLGATASQGRRSNPSGFFAAQTQGRPRQNLNALFDALDQADQRNRDLRRPPRRRQAFNNLMMVMDATMGSSPRRTQGVTDAELIGGSGKTGRRLLATFRPLMTIPAFISGEAATIRDRAAVRRAWQQISDAFSDTSPEGIRKIRAMADAGRSGGPAIRAAAELMGVRAPTARPDDTEE